MDAPQMDDGMRDAVALLRAALAGDEAGKRAILDHAPVQPLIQAIAELAASGWKAYALECGASEDDLPAAVDRAFAGLQAAQA